jgi:hypothetical protein
MMDARFLLDAKHPAAISRPIQKKHLALRAGNLREYRNDVEALLTYLEIAPRIDLEVDF